MWLNTCIGSDSCVSDMAAVYARCCAHNRIRNQSSLQCRSRAISPISTDLARIAQSEIEQVSSFSILSLMPLSHASSLLLQRYANYHGLEFKYSELLSVLLEDGRCLLKFSIFKADHCSCWTRRRQRRTTASRRTTPPWRRWWRRSSSARPSAVLSWRTCSRRCTSCFRILSVLQLPLRLPHHSAGSCPRRTHAEQHLRFWYAKAVTSQMLMCTLQHMPPSGTISQSGRSKQLFSVSTRPWTGFRYDWSCAACRRAHSAWSPSLEGFGLM